MKKLLIGLLAMLPFAVFAIATSSASATPEWLCGGGAVLTAKNCVVDGLNLEVLKLEDRGVPAAVECAPEAVESEGALLSATEGETSKLNFTASSTACKPSAKALNLKEEEETNGCEKLEKLEAENLPWKSKIEEEEAGPLWWILIISTVSGKAPAYKTTCEALKIKGIADTCESETTHTPLVLGENLDATEIIEGVSGILLFDIFFVNPPLEGEAEFANCTLGGKHQAIVIGENLLWGRIGGDAASLEIS